MKKLFAMLLALVMCLALCVPAFATEPEQSTARTTYEDMETVPLIKEYKLTNSGTTSPAETFTFTALTCTNVENAGTNPTTKAVVTKDTAPVPTIADVVYQAGWAGDATNAKQNIIITLPVCTAVGVYTYTFTENNGGTAGVTYRTDEIKLVVTVIEQDGKVRVATIHTESEGAKSASFDNTYSAGTLEVTKTVAGNMGDKDKEFDFTVVFTKPEGKDVNSTITATVNGTTPDDFTVVWDADGKYTYKFKLSDGKKAVFNNLPYGVQYTVTEADYGEGKGGYTTTKTGDTGSIDAASKIAAFTNTKNGEIDMGVTLESLPYVLALVIVAGGAAVMFARKRRVED